MNPFEFLPCDFLFVMMIIDIGQTKITLVVSDGKFYQEVKWQDGNENRAMATINRDQNEGLPRKNYFVLV